MNIYSQPVSLDSTFGHNGRIVIPNTSEISFFDFDTYSNIIAVGYTLKEGGKYDLTIVKTTADGVIDETFGNNGIAKVTDYDQIFPIGMKITKNNKIIVIGSFMKVQFQGYETIIMRFNENGTVDKNFGNNGKVNLNFNAGNIVSLNFDNDDFMLIAKMDFQNGNQNLYIEKYSYEGVIDNTFGENGKTYLTNSIFPYRMKILNNGSIIVAGTYNTQPNTELGLCKLTSAGKLDMNFAINGIWHKNTMQDFDLDHESFFDVLEDRDGNLILSGAGLADSLNWSNSTFLSKFSLNGELDMNFGENGFYCFDSGSISKPIFQIDDKYITAVRYNNESHKIIYVNGNGSFGEYVYTCDIYYFQAMKLQEGNKIILGGGHKDNTHGTNFVLERVIDSSKTSIKPETSIKLNNYSSDDLAIFPNPVKDNLYFSKETAFEIIDIQGQIMLKSTTPVKSVNISSFRTGVYFIRFENIVQKIIKE